MSKENELDISPVIRAPYPVSPLDDLDDGAGIHLAIGSCVVEVFPATRVTRARMGHTAARLTGTTALRVVQDVGFFAEARDGDCYTTLGVDETSLSLAVRQVRRSNIPEQVVEARIVAETEAATATVEPQERDSDRVTLVGRIGYAPKFRTTPRGTLVGSFSMNVHERPGDQGTWHKIVAFGVRAEKLRESGLGKGDEVQVVGYPHVAERRNQKTGEAKQDTQIYAAVVKKPKAKEE